MDSNKYVYIWWLYDKASNNALRRGKASIWRQVNNLAYNEMRTLKSKGV